MENGAAQEELYEELKIMAATRESCKLQFKAHNGGIAWVQTAITDVFKDDDGPYLLTEDGLILQLQQLVSVNGKPLDNFC